MVDYGANSAGDLLIDYFQSKLGASYVADCLCVSLFAAESNTYQNGSGTRIIRLDITGDGRLGPSTIRLDYTLLAIMETPLIVSAQSLGLGLSLREPDV